MIASGVSARTLRARLQATTAAVALLFSASAWAQDSVPPATEQEEVIVVTGSRIARPANVTAPTQVTTVGEETIELSGLTNVSDILRTVPSFGVPGLSSTNSNFLTSGAGINTLQLRNLGEDRTLVLVNGRRHVAGVPGSAAVDFNTIPVQMIERVEVITGGASAIYGSDAIAGVINIILQDDFEGFEAGYQYGESSEGDYISETPYFMAGANFLDGRGNITGLVSWDRQDGVYSRDRERTRVDDIATCLFTDDPADCQSETAPFYSSFSEFGRFTIIGAGEDYTLADGSVVPFDSNLYGYNRQQSRIVSVPTERLLLSANGRFDFTPSITGYVETTLAITDTASEIEPFPLGNADVGITGVSIDNPFVPDALRAAAIAAGDTEIGFARRLTEVGNRGTVGEREMRRIVLGLRGDIGARWNWDTFYSYGETKQSESSQGDVIVPNFINALNAVDLDGDPATTGDIVCADPAARAAGCAPINLFGRGSISDEAAGYVRAFTGRESKIEQQIFGATIGGSVFELPAGGLDVVVGVEWREESASDVPDPFTQGGLTAGNLEQPIFGEYDVWEGFIEAEAPLLRDLPFVYELTVGGAYRYSDYSTIGSTDAYTARVSYSPIESVRIRGQYARAVRAPNIGELFAPAGENFATVADPCNGVTATDVPGVVDDNCRSIPEIAARIAATGSFTLTQPEIQGTGGFTGGGNPNLDPETADSWNVGVVFDRDFDRAGRVQFSVDYFKIQIDDLIDTIDRQQSLDLCFNAAGFPNEFCGALVRDAAGPVFQQGELTEVNSGFINEGSLETSGIDVSLSYAVALEDVINRPWGDVALRANYAHLLDYEETKFGVDDSAEGEVGYSEHKVQGAVVYTIGPVRAQWETTYLSDAKPDSDPESLFYFDVGDYVVHDVQIGWDVFDSRANLYLGANNVFDEDAPLVLSGVPGNITGTDTAADVYDPIGRRWYAGARVRF